ncbi:MAG: hypothetical protein GF411_08210 [Candidatus Lokiarchaeota archaeon]|nr:hypothetical protein [Candidatus Lokiarchaeota archaeon]
MAFAGGAAGGSTAAATMHTSSYRVKFKKREFLELVEIARPDVIYHVGRIHFFAYDGFVMYTFEGETDYFRQKGITVIEAIEFSNTQWAE